MKLEQHRPQYYYETGWPNNIVNRFCISLGLYRKNYKYVKIGITTNPERRFCEHKRSSIYKWERMVVVYRTTSKLNANYMEKWFINNKNDKLVNIFVGDSQMCDSQFYYAYFLLGNHKYNTGKK